jgi:hypothetical protein
MFYNINCSLKGVVTASYKVSIHNIDHGLYTAWKNEMCIHNIDRGLYAAWKNDLCVQ